MTSPHDPPLSRRAARRALEAENAGAESFARPPEDGGSRSNSGWGTPSSVPSSAPTDMTYRTQVRPRVPHYDERALAVEPVVEHSAPNTQSPPPNTQPVPPVAPPAMLERVRRRDFRPPVVSDEPPEAAAPTYDAPLEYHTQLTHRSVTPPGTDVAPAPPTHVIDAASEAIEKPLDFTPEQTLSRRELRELRAAQLAETSAANPVASAVVPVEPGWGEPVHVEPAPVEAVPIEPVHVESAPVPQSQLAPILVEPVLVVPDLVHPAPVEQAPAVPTSTGSHWSTGIHDDDDPFENTFSRQVGSSTSLNTNALVLPEMPTGSIAGPVAGTGEIIVTGMITVSPLHSSTGAVPTLHDSPDIDDLFDAGDHEVSAPDSAPVSALKAISSHTSSHTVMTGKPSSSNTITTVLVGSTVGMAVIAIGLFVVAAANGLF